MLGGGFFSTAISFDVTNRFANHLNILRAPSPHAWLLFGEIQGGGEAL